MTIIGIDPGAGGAMAVWNKGISKIYKCPESTESMSGLVRAVRYIDKTKEVFAYVELVHAMTHDGRS